VILRQGAPEQPAVIFHALRMDQINSGFLTFFLTFLQFSLNFIFYTKEAFS
jgi:hypothetical protein